MADESPSELKDNHDTSGSSADSEFEERFPMQAEQHELEKAA